MSNTNSNDNSNGTSAEGKSSVATEKPVAKTGLAAQDILSSPVFLFKFFIFSSGTLTNAGSLHSSSPKVKGIGNMKLSAMRSLIPKMSSSVKVHEFCLKDGTEIDEDITVSTYLSMETDTVDATVATPTIAVYFKSTNEESSKVSEDVINEIKEMKADLTFQSREGQGVTNSTKESKWSDSVGLNESNYKIETAAVTSQISTMTETDWEGTLRNCSLMYGWYVDRDLNQIVRASKPAFRLRAGLNMPNTADTTSSDATGDRAPSFPTYHVNDNSRVEITLVTHEFEESMARNSFSSSSFQGSMSGGYLGFSVGVTAGVASEKSSGSSGAKSSYSNTMIASYKFPRVTVVLKPEDLEPTTELKDAIARVKRTKNINDLRKLHKIFGHLFCHEVVLGGCLQSSKITSGNSTESEDVQKEKFKASVGIAVNTPFGSASAQYQKESGSDQSFKTSSTNVSSGLLFEAQGGDTLLSSDPVKWCASVADCNNWRVIEQSKLSSLAGAISEIPGYEAIQEWFTQALTPLSEYLAIPASRTLDVRMKVLTEGDGMTSFDGEKAQSYLAFPDEPITPYRMELSRNSSFYDNLSRTKARKGVVIFDLTRNTIQVDIETKDTLFSPSTTRAPVLLRYPKNYYGANFDKEYLQSAWKFIVPHGQYLQHNSLVSLQPQNATKPLFMTVFRTQQGVFLPTISDSDEPSFWRVLKANDAADGVQIKEGDSITLCWRFSDQSSGFRDFMDDTFGRPRNTRPEGVQDELYLKVPFPRFEKSSERTVAMVMHSTKEDCPYLQSIAVRPRKGKDPTKDSSVSCNLRDVVFRVDSVGNDVHGESMNYMMSGMRQYETDTTATLNVITSHLRWGTRHKKVFFL